MHAYTCYADLHEVFACVYYIHSCIHTHVLIGQIERGEALSMAKAADADPLASSEKSGGKADAPKK
jgi:hypothetical protein